MKYFVSYIMEGEYHEAVIVLKDKIVDEEGIKRLKEEISTKHIHGVRIVVLNFKELN